MQKLIQWLGPILLNFFWDKLVIAFNWAKDYYDVKTGQKKILDAGNENVKEINEILKDGVTNEELEKLEQATRNLINGSNDSGNK